ncbi:MAG: YqzL family protein [Christensenellales bacterium]
MDLKFWKQFEATGDIQHYLAFKNGQRPTQEDAAE